MSIQVGELLVKASGDTRDAQSGLEAVVAQLAEVQKEAKEGTAQLRLIAGGLTDVGGRAAPSAAAGLEKVGTGAKNAKGHISAAAQAVSLLGGESAGAVGKVAGLAGNLTTSFAMGGAIGVGIGAAVSGVQMLATSMREAAAESRQLQALSDVLGVTERDVRNVERAFTMAGNELDRSVIQKLIATTNEAGISTVELAAMAGEIKRIQDLTGMDAAGAAAKLAADKAKAAGEDYIKSLKAQAKAREDQQAGVSAWQRTIEDGTAKDQAALDGLLPKLDAVTKAHGRAVALYGHESEEATKLRNEQRAMFDERDRLRANLTDASKIRGQLETQDEIDEGNKRADAYLAEVARKRAAAEADARRREAERKREAAEEERTQKTIAQAKFDSGHKVRLLEAQAAEDKKAEIDALADYEIAKAEAVAAEHVELAESSAAQIVAINAKRETDKAIIDREAAKEAKKNIKEAKREADKALKDTQGAQVAGIQAGSTFAQGLKAGIQSGDVTSVVKGLFSALGGLLTATGTPVAGAGLSAFGGLFHDGGMVGTGGKPLPKYHSGGMIVAHRGVMLPQPGPGEVPIMSQLGEGVLSRRGVAAAGGPQAVRSYNEGRAPAAGATATTTYQVMAFDPRSMAEVIGSTVEPAQYRRGVSRADAKLLAQQRRQIRAPRSGRLT